MSDTKRIKNIGTCKLVLAPGFSLSPGQSRDATEDDFKKMNPAAIEGWVANKLIEVGGSSLEDEQKLAAKKAADARKEVEEAQKRAKAAEEASAKAKAKVEAAAKESEGKQSSGDKSGNGGDKSQSSGGGKMPGA